LLRSTSCLLVLLALAAACKNEPPPASPSPSDSETTKPPPAAAPAESVPGLPPEVIQTIVRSSHGDMRKCYVTGLGRNPKLEGTVKVQFVIGEEGRVVAASDPDSDIADPEVRKCVLAVFARMEFPKPTKLVSVTYPLRFEPAEPACTLGADQSCNDDPRVSALWGRCLPNGTCACQPGAALNRETGKCRAGAAATGD
jgi:hypothetical protein